MVSPQLGVPLARASLPLNAMTSTIVKATTAATTERRGGGAEAKLGRHPFLLVLAALEQSRLSSRRMSGLRRAQAVGATFSSDVARAVSRAPPAPEASVSRCPASPAEIERLRPVDIAVLLDAVHGEGVRGGSSGKGPRGFQRHASVFDFVEGTSACKPARSPVPLACYPTRALHQANLVATEPGPSGVIELSSVVTGRDDHEHGARVGAAPRRRWCSPWPV